MKKTELTITFVSNYFNHHQRALSDSLWHLTGARYCFVETEPMPKERRALGWQDEPAPDYLRRWYASPDEARDAQAHIDRSDVVLFGSAPEHLLDARKQTGGLILYYAERANKSHWDRCKYPYRYIRWRRRYRPTDNAYLLCAGAYAAADMDDLGLFRNKCYRWGYFPAVQHYADLDALIAAKRPASLLWVGRLIGWKHPEVAIEVIERLRRDGIEASLDIIGSGELKPDLERMIRTRGLSSCVHLLGAMPPEAVRTHMEQSEVCLVTSDRREGWGVVLNEAMNSACAVVAGHAVGAAPYLIRDGENGFLYRDGDIASLCAAVRRVLDDPTLRLACGRAAYRTVAEQWSPDLAAERFLCLAEALLRGDTAPTLFDEGPCSPAPLLRDASYAEHKPEVAP